MTTVNYNEIFGRVKEASRRLATVGDSQISNVILTLADLVDRNHKFLLDANAHDLERMETSNPLYDRLQLTPRRLEEISESLRKVAALPSPVGETIESRRLQNGIQLQKVRVPFGVIGVVYEARPNVTFDVFALCIKSGNASVLKGGKDANDSNIAIISLIHQALRQCQLPEDTCVLLPPGHDSTEALLKAVGFVDVCIPRGGRKLIDFVRNEAKVPVIETGAGVVHVYFDNAGDMELGKRIIDNAKTRRVSVCNALDSLLVHRSRLDDLSRLVEPLAAKNVEIHADNSSFAVLEGRYPEKLLKHADDTDCDREWMDYKLGVYTVDSVEEAVGHITRHGSGHSESIISDDKNAVDYFKNNVDASCVYVNLPTSFTDGGQFELGAEIGISTQKLGVRGPMGLREMTTYKYILCGEGQIRP